MAGRLLQHALVSMIVIFGVAATAQALEVVGSDRAEFAWEPVSGSAKGYVVFVSRNKGPLEIYRDAPFVTEPRVSVRGAVGDMVEVAVWALAPNGAPGNSISPVSYPVRFTSVASPPKIQVSTPSILLSSTPGFDAPATSLQIVNSGGGSLDFQVRPATPWLSATPGSGSSATGDVPVSVRVDPGALEPGLHLSALQIQAPGASPVSVPVFLYVAPPIPVFSISQDRLDVPAIVNDAPQAALLFLDCDVPGSWYRVTTDAPWIQTGFEGSQIPSGGATLAVALDPTGLARGTHSGNLYVVPDDERSRLLVVRITLTVVDLEAPRRAIPDLDADGRADLVFRDRATGAVEPWTMDGHVKRASARYAGPAPLADWALAAVADVDVDGRADLVWGNAKTGAAMAWIMDGAARRRLQTLPKISEAGWALAAVDDFDGDLRTDLLWHHPATGRVRVQRYASAASLGTFDPERAGENVVGIAGTGDFDASGTADVVWRTPAGFRLWISRDGGAGEVVPLDAPPEAGWQVAGVADQDGDGKSDLVWRNDLLRETRLWRFESPILVDTGPLPDLRRPGWAIASTSDLDGDGETDLVWRSSATGDTAVWLMEGFDLRRGSAVSAPPPASFDVVP